MTAGPPAQRRILPTEDEAGQSGGDEQGGPCLELERSRTRWLDQACAATASDPRVAALLLSGSLARGDGDRWSDLDLIVVTAPAVVEELSGDVTGCLMLPGRRLFVLEKPRNAPTGGAHQGAL